MNLPTHHAECSLTIKNILCEALINFACFSDDVLNHANRSRMRKDLLAITHEIEQQFVTHPQFIQLDKRACEYCELAINYHYDRIYYLLNTNVEEQRKLMLSFLTGTSIDDEQLDSALLKDNMI